MTEMYGTLFLTPADAFRRAIPSFPRKSADGYEKGL